MTKSGTSTLRGSGWYNARRDSWNANDYFRERQGQPKPLYRVNIGGFSVGGPVVIPRVLDSRTSQRKVFFFGSQEFTQDARPTQTATANYPTDLERRGDFSHTYATIAGPNYGTVQPIIDYRTGQPFPGNIIPMDRINPIGAALLNLMLQPNGYVPPGAGHQYDANFINNDTPQHSRINYVYRADVVLNDRWRFNGKALADQENNIAVSAFGPGFGKANNTVPAWQVAGTLTTVISPTLVTELNGGFTINHYNEVGYPDNYDYKQYFCATLGACAPRIAPYGTYYGYNDPPQNSSCSGSIDGKQLDQYPYVPVFTTAGGNRTGLAGYSPAIANGRVMPTCNHDRRYVFQDDVTKVKGRHTFKMGFYLENDETLAPVSGTNYMGSFNFGSSNTNPLDSGNGYANMLLGVITSYTEVTNRIAWNVGHWEIDGYAQDTWRVNPRLTINYGLRVTHNGGWYETNDMTAAFYPELYDPTKAVRLYRPVCTNGAPGNVACPNANQAAIDPANPGVFLPFQLAGTVVPGSGTLLNGINAGGRDHDGSYYDYPKALFGPRVGMAWDIHGDHRAALRASAGVFYDFPRGGLGSFIGVPPVSYSQQVNNLTMDQLAAYSTGGSLTFSQNPVGAPQATVSGTRYKLPTTYQTYVAYQRDIGFSTTVEAAYVGNFTRNGLRTYNVDPLPLYGFADPKNQFNQAALSANYLYAKYPGMGAITDFTNDLATLSYHAAQFSVQRRLSRGLQMGMAYTLAHGYGMQGWDPYTADPNLVMNWGGIAVRGGPDALRARYWGPTSVDRRHNLTVNYSYVIPTLGEHNAILKAALGNWQVSGVTKLLSGTAVNPTCSNTTTRGVAYSLPSYTNGITQTAFGVTSGRCNLTGQPINAGVRVDPDPANPDPLTAQNFNLAAFAMPTPLSATVGDFGNAPLGLLRNPTISEWDVTIERRFPIRGTHNGVRLQFQAYNLFNQVEFTTLDAALTFTGTTNIQSSTTAGTYRNPPAGTPAVINPRQLGLTVRLDF